MNALKCKITVVDQKKKQKNESVFKVNLYIHSNNKKGINSDAHILSSQ